MRDERRWIVLLSAVGLMMCIGTAYSWSLFTRPLMAFYGWSSIQVGLAFAIMVFSIGIGALTGGVLHDRFGARPVGIAGAALWGLGSILAGVGLSRFGLTWLYLTYGLIGGIGGGMAYVVPGACATRWFGKQRGLANGVVLFGFGAGSLVYNSILDAVPAFIHTADNANRLILSRKAGLADAVHTLAGQSAVAAGMATIEHVFVASGIAVGVIGACCAFGLLPPPPSSSRAGKSEHDFTPREMLSTPTFYVIWLIVFINCFAGLALLGNAIPIYSELTAASATAAAAAYGYLSIFNGIGRLVWALLSDSIGRIWALVAAFAIEGASLIVLTMMHAPIGVSIAFAFAVLCFGGILAITPAIMADYYGMRFLGEDYGFIISAASIAGLAGPVLFGLVEDATGSLTRTIAPIGIVLIVAALLPFIARKPVV